MSGGARKPRLRPDSLGVKLALLAVLCGTMSLLGGCWDQRYLDKLGVVMALGIDADPTGKQEFLVTVQVVLPQNVAAESKGGLGGAPVTTFSEAGKTLFEALRKMSSKTSRRLFFSHTQLVVIGESAARKGIYPLVDLIERNPDIRSDISIVCTRGIKAQQLLQMTTQMENIPVNQFREMLDVNQSAYGTNYAVYVKDIIRIRGKGQKQAVLPSIRADGDKLTGRTVDNVSQIPPAEIPVLSTMAVFREGKLVDYLKPKESRGLSWLHDKVKSTVINLACPQADGYLVVEVQEASTGYKIKSDEEGMPVVNAEIRLTGSVQEIMCPDLDVMNEGVLNNIGELAAKAVKDEAEAAIIRLQKKLRTDALGWGKEIYLKAPSIWKRIEDDWPDVFPRVNSTVTCNVKIAGSGTRGESILK
ncbi:Ger(x)C family spore germination protein [Paenibacillus sp. N4]|uniref:Ger(x)C family spore germination protein n=1 Tax=Paenibacillus vietnamensis TaxID=2590547 RepID=UPI001CD0485F|nr:Ger(x)C family spore germination protein [Paenibacillus vietnamensis]MCA0758595.1 Ger(x)C family spore germination protein [Paenibacillus vietnamensis]